MLTDQAAAMNDISITEFMDLNALTQTPADPYPSFNITTHETNSTTLSKRYDFKDAPFQCHGNDVGYADVDSVVAGIKHLTSSKVKGKPSNAAMSCGRVSCSDNAAIWWCNKVRSLVFTFVSRLLSGVLCLLIKVEPTNVNARLVR